MIYLGVSSHIAESRGRQDKRGNMLGEKMLIRKPFWLGVATVC